MPSSVWLAVGETSTTNGVNLMDPGSILIEAGGWSAPPPKIRTYHNRKKGNIYNQDPYRIITAKLRITGPSADAMWSNYRTLERLLDQAPRRQGVDKTGKGLSCWVMLIGSTDYVFFDVLDGNLIRSYNRDTEGGQSLYAELSLICRPLARGRPYKITQTSTLVNGTTTQYIGNVPGDSEALVQAYIRDKSTAGALNRLYGSVKTHPLAGSGDYAGIFGLNPAGTASLVSDATAFAGSTPHLLATTSFADLGLYQHDGSALQHGLTDVYVRARDGSVFTGAPTKFTCALDASWDKLLKNYSSQDIWIGNYFVHQIFVNSVGTYTNDFNLHTQVTVAHGVTPTFYQSPGDPTSGTAVVGVSYTKIADALGDQFTYTFQGTQGPLANNVEGQLTIAVCAVYSDGTVSSPSNYVTLFEPKNTTVLNLAWKAVGSPVDYEVRFFVAQTPPGPSGNESVLRFRTGSSAVSLSTNYPFSQTLTNLGTDALQVTSGGFNPGSGSATAAGPSFIRAQVAVDTPHPLWQQGAPVKIPLTGNWYLLYLGRFQLPPSARRADGQPTPWVAKIQAKNTSSNVASVGVDVDCLITLPAGPLVLSWAGQNLTDSAALGWKYDQRRDGAAGCRLTRYTFDDGAGFPFNAQEAMVDVQGHLGFGPGGNIVTWIAERENGLCDFVNTKFTVEYYVTPRYAFQKGVT